MPSNDDASLPWFRRFRSDGRMEPVVGRGDDGEIAVLDKDWVASFKNGKWHETMLFSHLEFAEFSPVQDRGEVYRLYNESRAAFGLPGEDPTRR